MFTRGSYKFFAGVCTVLLLPCINPGQEKNEERKGSPTRDGLLARAVHLMPPGIAVQLRLTQEQQAKIEKLDQEFRQMRRDALTKAAMKIMNVVDSMQAEEDGELAPVLAICHEVTGGLLESRRTRMAYERKMLAVLDASQKEQFARLKEMGPHDRHQHRLAADRDAAELQHAPFLKRLEGLQLTEEQRKKLADLTKEMESRFRNLLTEEQRQRLDDLKRGDQKRDRVPGQDSKGNDY